MIFSALIGKLWKINKTFKNSNSSFEHIQVRVKDVMVPFVLMAVIVVLIVVTASSDNAPLYDPNSNYCKVQKWIRVTTYDKFLNNTIDLW